MKIEGSHIFAAQKALIWSLLHNPELIRLALPGCDQFDQVSATDFTAVLHIQEGPFQGDYSGTINLLDHIFQEAFSLKIKAEGPEGTIWGEGDITLSEENGQNTLHYEGEIVVNGRSVIDSPRLLKTTANALIRQFLEAIEHYIQIQTGIYTTETINPALKSRRSGTIDMRDKIEEIRQNRQTTLIVIFLIALASLMTVGASVIVFFIIRWGLRFFRQYVLTVVQEDQQNYSLDKQN